MDGKLSVAIDLMIKNDHKHRILIDSSVRDIGIPHTQHRILMRLAKHRRLPSQKDLAEHLNITAAAVTGALKKLENQGYIERTLGQDNRYNEISITEKGRALVESTREAFSRVDVSLFDGFTEDELDSYISCLDKMRLNMDARLEEIHINHEKGKIAKQ